jgi:hypothetical protein
VVLNYRLDEEGGVGEGVEAVDDLNPIRINSLLGEL